MMYSRMYVYIVVVVVVQRAHPDLLCNACVVLIEINDPAHIP